MRDEVFILPIGEQVKRGWVGFTFPATLATFFFNLVRLYTPLRVCRVTILRFLRAIWMGHFDVSFLHFAAFTFTILSLSHFDPSACVCSAPRLLSGAIDISKRGEVWKKREKKKGAAGGRRKKEQDKEATIKRHNKGGAIKRE